MRHVEQESADHRRGARGQRRDPQVDIVPVGRRGLDMPDHRPIGLRIVQAAVGVLPDLEDMQGWTARVAAQDITQGAARALSAWLPAQQAQLAHPLQHLMTLEGRDLRRNFAAGLTALAIAADTVLQIAQPGQQQRCAVLAVEANRASAFVGHPDDRAIGRQAHGRLVGLAGAAFDLTLQPAGRQLAHRQHPASRKHLLSLERGLAIKAKRGAGKAVAKKVEQHQIRVCDANRQPVSVAPPDVGRWTRSWRPGDTVGR